jgi:hypothetical protein
MIEATYSPRGQGQSLAAGCLDVAVFGEWRLSQDRVALRDTGFLGVGDQERLDMTQTMQQYVFGLSYRS